MDSSTISRGSENKSGFVPASNVLPEDLDSLRAEFITLGGNPRHKQFAAKEAAVVEQAQKKAEAELRRREAMRPKWAKTLSNFVAQALSAISVVFVVIVVLLGVLGVSLLMVIAEVAVIHDGIASVTEANSWLYAHALVLLYLLMLFAREILVHNPDEAKYAREMFSLQHLANWLRYFVGGKHWRPRVKNESLIDGANLTVKWLMMSVLLLGVLGRLAPKLDTFSGSWHEALKHIITSSTLSDMLGYVASIGISVGLMLGSHFITNFVFREYTKLTGGVNTQDFFGDFSPSLLVEREVVLLYQDEVLRLRAKNQPPQLQAATATVR